MAVMKRVKEVDERFCSRHVPLSDLHREQRGTHTPPAGDATGRGQRPCKVQAPKLIATLEGHVHAVLVAGDAKGSTNLL